MIFWLFIGLLALGVLAWVCRGSTVRLAWDRSPSTNNIVDYQVYWGPATRFYTNHFHAGTNLTATITNLLPGRTYYFAATATDNYGQESGFSAEVFTTTPANSNIIVTVTLTVQTATNLPGPWSNWLTLPVQTMTNPPVPGYYRSVMNITSPAPERKILKLNSSTLVFTNT